MAVSHELVTIIQEAKTRGIENRDIVPVSYAQRRFCRIVLDTEPDQVKQEQIIASLLPVVEWLTKPRSIDEFQELKQSLMALDYSRSYSWIQQKYREEANEKIDAVRSVLNLAREFKIFLEEYVRGNGGPSVEYVWSRVEGNIPTQTQRVDTHNSLEDLVKALDESRTKPWYKLADVARVGLLMGDFRVGDHKEHGELIKEAKLALGRYGRLAVITPTRRTILNTTDKTDSWDDDNRVYRLMGNRFINDLWLADMSEEFYARPDKYWEYVYKSIKPDLVLLGEENHPLESAYRNLTINYGGILLIDPKPIGTRSGDLLRVK